MLCVCTVSTGESRESEPSVPLGGGATDLRGMRGTVDGVEAAVMTWRICSRAEMPPPTWKAT